MPNSARIVTIILYVIILIIGLLNAILPRFMWRLFQSWKATKEPTSAYFMVTRIGGIVVVVVILLLLLFPYFINN